MASNNSRQPLAQPDDPHKSPSYQSDTPARGARQIDAPKTIEDRDEELGGLTPGSEIFWKAHHQLQRICLSQMLLPSSHLLSSDALEIADHPFTSGGFSDIYTATYEGRQICVKKLRVASDGDRRKAEKLFCREALIWKRLNHRNIVPFIGITTDLLQIASEWMPGGTLMTYVSSNLDQNQIHFLIPLLIDVASGLEYLHSFGVVHSDLKGPNILIDSFGRACITDFGLAQSTFGEVRKLEGQSVRWTAPEVLAEERTPSVEADVFSFAMVMIEVFTGKIPFHQESSAQATMTIITGERPKRPTLTCTDELWELMQKCWDKNPDERPQMSEVLRVLNSLPLPDLAPQHEEPNSLGTRNLSPPPERRPDIIKEAFPTPNGRKKPEVLQLSHEEADPSTHEFLLLDHPNKELNPPAQTPDPPAKEPNSSNGVFGLLEENIPFLQELFSDEGLKPHVPNFSEKIIRGLVESLDEVLNKIPVTHSHFPETLSRLRSICSNHEVLPLSCLIPLEKLSNRGASIAGGSADVDHAEFDGKRVFIKNVRSYAPDSGCVIRKQKLYGQLVVWKRLRHPNIVPVLGFTTKPTPPFEVVYDRMENGRITDYARKQLGVDRIGLLWDVADGLHFLHSCGITHGDLKAANVLIDREGRARLVGFGLTSIIQESVSDAHPEGRNPVIAATWAAPEALNSGAVTKEGDIFMFGIVVVEAFESRSMRVERYRHMIPIINDGKYPEQPKEMLGHNWLWEVVKRCWAKDPRERPDTRGLLDSFRTSYPGERENSKTHPFSLASSTETVHPEGNIPESHLNLSAGGSQKAGRNRWRSRVTPRLKSGLGKVLNRKKKMTSVSDPATLDPCPTGYKPTATKEPQGGLVGIPQSVSNLSVLHDHSEVTVYTI